MSRPKKTAEQARIKRIEVRLTQQEEKSLQDHADERGLTISDFIRSAALGIKPRIQKATPYRAALIRGLAELGKNGSNVNQIARALNRSHQPDQPRVPVELIEGVLHGLQTLSTHLIRILTDGDTR